MPVHKECGFVEVHQPQDLIRICPILCYYYTLYLLLMQTDWLRFVCSGLTKSTDKFLAFLVRDIQNGRLKVTLTLYTFPCWYEIGM